jgi:hypothetical protein
MEDPAWTGTTQGLLQQLDVHVVQRPEQLEEQVEKNLSRQFN